MGQSQTFEQMENLKQLSEVDGEIARLADTRATLQRKIQSIENSLKERKAEIKNKLREVKETEHREHREEVELKEIEEEMEKVKLQINTARTNEELGIFKKKRDELKKKISDLEDDVLDRLTTLDKTREEIEESGEALEREERNARVEVAELRAQITQCEKETADLSGKRGSLVSQIPHDILTAYERILAKEKHQPVAEVRNHNCQGCFMKVTLQDVNRLWRGRDLVRCRNCKRILYLPEDERHK